ncbi:MAG: FYDLN acid domain-containing protein, partial [Myxococcota bacterium]
PKKVAAKKAAPKKVAAKKATPKKAAPKNTAAEKATKAAAKKSPARKAQAKPRAKKVPGLKGKKTALVPLAVHPRFGNKFECFGCGARFYDLGREEPICPKCEVDQREKPSDSAPPSASPPKGRRKAAARPMAPLLDDDEEVAAPAEEDIQLLERKARSGEKLFDDAVVASEESEEGS